MKTRNGNPKGEASCSVVLIGEDFLATLTACHAVLLLLAEFGRGQLLGLLAAFDLVAHGILQEG